MSETRTPPSSLPPRRGPAEVGARTPPGPRDETRPPGELRREPAREQPGRDEPVREEAREETTARPARATRARPLSPIVPGSTVTGHALVAVVAIMTFLAALTVGTVASVRTLASGWTAEISREVTIQIKPADGLDIEAALARATQVTRSTPGVAAARPLAAAETAKLLEPWLGAGIDVTNLPVPRLIVVTLASNAEPAAIQALKASLAAQVPSASLDDHRQWSARLSSTARAVVVMGLGVLALVSAATILSVVFATRAAVAAGRPIVEVLHFVGARDSFIAAEFQQHFLTIGLKGGAIGGGAAMALFFALTALPIWLGGGAGGQPTDTLVGGMTLDLRGYGGIFGVAVLVALVTSATSRITVLRTLRSIN
ncbi:MAG: putative cell division protein [Xanthobacteraceae bacterium]|jgi:cell division transport system permease protein|nr:putative cell division protein [Xanthobacteraceae bacterium]